MKGLFKKEKKQKTETSNAHDSGSGLNLMETMLNRPYQHRQSMLPSTLTAPTQMQAVSSPCSSAPKLDVNDVMVSSLASDFTQMQVGHSGSGPSASTLGHTMATTNPTALEHKPSKKRKRSRISSRVTIGQEMAFNEVRDCLTKSEVGMVGFYGMGGVGKTTLMKKVCYEFLIPSNFKVIWIVVSRPVNVRAIQRSIMEELNLKFNKEQDPEARGMDINKTLFNSKSKVALLLDDIWESLDLEELGVAGGFELDTSKFKIIFTTRSEDVCLQMNPDEVIKVECLGWEESWALFKQSVGDKTLNSHDQIIDLAEEVAKECAGLPLALTVIGKAMVCKTSPEAWEDALKRLTSCPSLISGAEKNLFERLKFSYDNLENQVERECFLFCCMYPEDEQIDTDTLVGSWIGEGLLDIGYGTYEETWNRGHGIIDTLVAKSLLEFHRVRIVKMHDVIRDMGLWIGSESNYFVHTASLKLSGQEITRRWNTARWIYVEDHNDDLPQEFDCPNLSTLYINYRTNKSDMVGIMNFMNDKYDVKVLIMESDSFTYSPIPTFGHFVGLRHLEINLSDMEALPDDIGNLTKLLVLILVVNEKLSMLPPTIGGLCELRKLKITCFDDLENIPSELGKLKKLEMVDICAPWTVYKGNIFNDCTELRMLYLKVKNLTELPNGLAYNCKKLEKLYIRSLDRYDMRPEDGSLFTKSLARLTSLKVLIMKGCPIADGDEVIFAIRHMRLLRELRIKGCSIAKLVIPEEIDFLPHLEVLEIKKCRQLEEVHFRKRALQSLCIFKISYCECLAHVVGLQHLLQLRELDIDGLPDFEAVLITTTDDEGHCFPNLQRLLLRSLPRMKHICNDNVSFPSLSEFTLSDCPMLEKLPRGLMNENRSTPMIRRLCLESLGRMKHICNDNVSFPSLSEFRLYDCPMLEKLPRGLMNENKLTPTISGEIAGTEEWWEGLAWEDDAFKSYLRPLATLW